MKYRWIDAYLLAKPAVIKDFKQEWNWIRYRIGGKMFAAVLLDESGAPYSINLKLEPMEGAFLRQQYEDILPGYYSNKQHWNSVRADGAVPDALLMDMLDQSYALVLHGLSKKKQRELLITTYCGLDCAGCEWKEKARCGGCVDIGGLPFHCQDEPCPIAACAIGKAIPFCGMCEAYPCGLLNDYSCDPEHGDTPPGARIKACQMIRSLLSL